MAVALTAGEPAGIGPDLCAMFARERFAGPLVIVGDREVIAQRAAQRGLPFDIPDYSRSAKAPVSLLHIPVAVRVEPGRLDARNGRHVVALLDRALEGCVAGEFAAMCTAPVQKSTINESGLPFTGHTEYLAERTGTKQVVMLLAGAGLRVALVTTHLALADVPRAITRERVASVLRVLDHDLRERFRIPNPRILVAGLNPHAGESGYLGREEIDVIAPVIASLAAGGMNVAGPYPADTLFTPRMLEGADAELAMYHDQGLTVLKHAAFGDAVNVTLGLPIVRTSVDHGTALDRAGQGEVDGGSLRAAIALAFELAPARLIAMLPRPRKRFGQHFLTDRHYLGRIVAAIDPAPGQNMVEIGPGSGLLTEQLVPRLDRLHVIEIDRDLAATLRGRFDPEKVAVHEGDVLEFDFLQLPVPLRVVGNLPYNVSSPILFRMADIAERVSDCVFMLQKEVVDRMVAQPDSPDYGRLSVMLQYRFAMGLAFNVPPGAFTPPPKVDSAVVRMAPLPANRLRARDEARLAAIVAAAFGQRRKTLRNATRALVPVEAFDRAGIDPGRRGETLSVAEFVALSDAFP